MVRSFRSYGGVAQLHLRDASDLEAIEVLDEARWAATSVPTVQFNCDPGFLRFLDADGDGRVRLHDVREAQRWTWAHLAERSRLDLESDIASSLGECGEVRVGMNGDDAVFFDESTAVFECLSKPKNATCVVAAGGDTPATAFATSLFSTSRSITWA